MSQTGICADCRMWPCQCQLLYPGKYTYVNEHWAGDPDYASCKPFSAQEEIADLKRRIRQLEDDVRALKGGGK